MKTFEELQNTPNLQIVKRGIDGGLGYVFRDGKRFASVVWSTGAGWDHVSLSPLNRRLTPSWEDMCRLKDMFFHEDECCVQFHPPKSRYVNNLQNCLHIWKPLAAEIPMPPDIMVGIKRGMSLEDVQKEIAALTAQ